MRINQSMDKRSNDSTYEILRASLGDGEFNYSYNISIKHKYLYIENAKSACTSIKYNLGKLEFSDARLGEEIPKKYLDYVHTNVLGTPFVKPFQCGSEFFDQVCHDKEFFRFTFVRNPFTRVLSGYLDKVLQRRFESQQIFAALRKEMSAEVTFNEFLDAIFILNKGRALDKHWRSQYVQCGSGLLQLDFVGKVENFSRDFSLVLDRVASSPLDVERINVHATDAGKKIEKFYDTIAIQKVLELYEDDFRYFGYSRKLSSSHDVGV